MKELHIAYDSREQQPMHWHEHHCGTAIHWHRAALDTFDYCVWRDWVSTRGETVLPNFAIERKSVGDFISSWFSKSSKNELLKIERAQRWIPRPTIYIVEGNLSDFAQYDYSRFHTGVVQARSVMSKIDQLRYRNVQVILAGNRRCAEYTIISILKKRAHEIGAKARRELWGDAT